MHTLPFLASTAPMPAGQTALMLVFYVSTVPSFIVSAIAGRAVGWGIFQILVLVLGLWQYWHWTEQVTNGIRLIGVYVVYGCLNVITVMIFVLYSVLARGQGGLLWPIGGLALAALIAVLTTRIIRSFRGTNS